MGAPQQGSVWQRRDTSRGSGKPYNPPGVLSSATVAPEARKIQRKREPPMSIASHDGLRSADWLDQPCLTTGQWNHTSGSRESPSSLDSPHTALPLKIQACVLASIDLPSAKQLCWFKRTIQAVAQMLQVKANTKIINFLSGCSS